MLAVAASVLLSASAFVGRPLPAVHAVRRPAVSMKALELVRVSEQMKQAAGREAADPTCIEIATYCSSLSEATEPVIDQQLIDTLMSEAEALEQARVPRRIWRLFPRQPRWSADSANCLQTGECVLDPNAGREWPQSFSSSGDSWSDMLRAASVRRRPV